MIKIWCSAIFKQQQNVIVRSSLEIRVSVGERKILTTYLVSFWKRERLTKLNSEYICSISLNGNNDWLRAIHQYIYIAEPNKIFFSNKRNKSNFAWNAVKSVVKPFNISLYVTLIIFKANIMICIIYCFNFCIIIIQNYIFLWLTGGDNIC